MSKKRIILRASLMLTALAALVAGATYALPTSTATLTGNEVKSLTANLQVDGPDDNTFFGTTEEGFKFNSLLPGATEYSQPQVFKLKNEGTADLSVAVAATAGTGSLDPTKVHIKITNTTETGSTPIEYTLSELVSSARNLPGVTGTGSLQGDNPEITGTNESETNAFDVQVKIDDGTSGDLTNFNLVFTGTAVVPTTPPVTPSSGE